MVGRAARLASFREARGALNLPTGAIECDPRARPRIERAPAPSHGVAWGRAASFDGGRSSRVVARSGALLALGQSSAAPSRSLVRRSRATPIRWTRTPSVAASWETPVGVENSVRPVDAARGALGQADLIE
jgi:hypothetical protein